tara:strand:+ start:49 stop:177 length:129 start_codon:yes stop_codon:yes gene_type:complete
MLHNSKEEKMIKEVVLRAACLAAGVTLVAAVIVLPYFIKESS